MRSERLQNVINGFRAVNKSVYSLIFAQATIQLVNASFFLLFNYYMDDEGYTDDVIARVISWRFGAVMLLAFPLGFFIKGRRIKPFLFIAGFGVPIFSIMALLLVPMHNVPLLSLCLAGWGGCFVFLQAMIVPYIMLNTPEEQHSEAIALSFQTFSLSIFIAGIMNYVLHAINPTFFSERNVMMMFAIIGFFAIGFLLKLPNKEKVSGFDDDQLNLSQWNRMKNQFMQYDWRDLIMVLIPTFLIAIGAGFTIPVINLFFLYVHEIPSSQFSIMGSLSYFLVVICIFFVPSIKRKFGYKFAITGLQSLAIISLFLMAITEYFSTWQWAAAIAIFFYMIRQPLMNTAGPMTSELSMYYVGEKNREMLGALNSAIWSGSWFVSLGMFAYMRTLGWRYVTIFLFTVALYSVGVAWYALLIRNYNRRVKHP